MRFNSFVQAIRSQLPQNQIIDDELRRVAWSTDASPFHLIPRLVIKITNETQLICVLRTAKQYAVPLTFRGSGTSLSGQTQTNRVLILYKPYWQNYSIDNLGEYIHLQTGITGKKIKKLLAPFHRGLCIDNDIFDNSTIGGMVANNEYTPYSPRKENGYHTLFAIKVILLDGTILDTKDLESIRNFKLTHRHLCLALINIRKKILNDVELISQIHNQYQLKHSIGYQLNAFLDFSDPIDILSHLMTGSEGTLGFISEISLSTRMNNPYHTIILFTFNTVYHLRNAIERLLGFPAASIEFLDCTFSHLFEQHLPKSELTPYFTENNQGILVKIESYSQDKLNHQIERLTSIASTLNPSNYSIIDSLHDHFNFFNNIASKLPAFIEKSKKQSLRILTENISIAQIKMDDFILDAKKLLNEYDYSQHYIYGSISHNIVSIVMLVDLTTDILIEHYQAFIDRLAQLIIYQYAGIIASSGGTGQFKTHLVEKQWGSKAYMLHKEIKNLFDPLNLLNPHLIIHQNNQLQQDNLKKTILTHSIIDYCNDCGKCETDCPSHHYSFSPKQRISVLRALKQKQLNNDRISFQWERDFQHLVINSCTSTGICEDTCPLSINTGEIIISIRSKSLLESDSFYKFIVRHFAFFSSSVRGLLWLGSLITKVIDAQTLERISKKIQTLTKRKMPIWLSTLPKKGQPIYTNTLSSKRLPSSDTIVYWSSCSNQSLSGTLEGNTASIPDAVRSLLHKANYHIIYPKPSRGLCCGKPLRHQGHVQLSNKMRHELLDSLFEISDGGHHPILTDSSNCALEMKQEAKERGIRLYEPGEFIHDFLLKRLYILPDESNVAVHMSCCIKKFQFEAYYQKIFNQLTPNWFIPEDIPCCGFSGIQGFWIPEISELALQNLASQVSHCAYGITINRSCELALSRHSSIHYYSLFEILNKQSLVPKLSNNAD